MNSRSIQSPKTALDIKDVIHIDNDEFSDIKSICAIKIEPDDSLHCVENTNTEKVDKGVQTDADNILRSLKQIVNARMLEYEDRRTPKRLLAKLMNENKNLQSQINVLKRTLQNMQNNLKISGKRIPTEIQCKTSVIPIQCSEPPRKVIQTHAIKNPTARQICPLSSAPFRPQQPILPVQMVSPVQQRLPSFRLVGNRPQINSEYIIVDPNNLIQGNMCGINTQLVASNQGLRMTSLRNDIQLPQTNPQPRLLHPFLKSNSTVQTNIRPQVEVPRNILSISEVYNPATISYNSPQVHMPTDPQLPKLKASISASGSGIILTWNYEQPVNKHDNYKVECYQLFAHHAKDGSVVPPQKAWRRIGLVRALPLPMACTLSPFSTGNVYHFAVVAVDVHGKEGEISNPCIIRLNLNK